MELQQVAVYAPRSEFLELSRTPQGRVFRKHILTKGSLRHPVSGLGIKIDDKFVKQMIENFDKGVCDIVQIPLAGEKNEHTEAPDRNIGEVVGLEETDGKVYALLDVRDQARADQMGKTLLGASAMLHTDYLDTGSGEKVGPTLLHVAITNRPYLTGLEEFRELIAATAESTNETVLLTQEDGMDLEQLLTALKNEHGIDVHALMEEVEQARASATDESAEGDTETDEGDTETDEVKADAEETKAEETKADEVPEVKDEESIAATALSNVIEALQTSGVIELSAGVVDPTPAVEALVEKVADLEGAMRLTAAETTVDTLIQAGRIVPATRDGMVALCLSDPELFESVVPQDAVVALSNELGTVAAPEPGFDIESEIARLSEIAQTNGYVKK